LNYFVEDKIKTPKKQTNAYAMLNLYMNTSREHVLR